MASRHLVVIAHDHDHPCSVSRAANAAHHPCASSFSSSSPRSSSCAQKSQRSSSISCWSNAVLGRKLCCCVPDCRAALQGCQHPCAGRVYAVIPARLEIQDDCLVGERPVHDVLRKTTEALRSDARTTGSAGLIVASPRSQQLLISRSGSMIVARRWVDLHEAPRRAASDGAAPPS